MMTNEEIKKIIMQRAYAGVFEKLGKIFNLHKFAEEKGIDNDSAWKAFEELKAEGLIDYAAMGGYVRPTSRGLIYCENKGIADEKVAVAQQKVRTRLLVTLAEIQDQSSDGSMTDWEIWINKAGVDREDWENNERILVDFDLIHQESNRSYIIRPYGRERVEDYRKRQKRADDFERLERLDGVTVQQRGHSLEDLLADTAEWEGWEVSRRVRAQGQEIDIIMHTGTHYFLSSCKWESAPIQPAEAELLESRVRSRATTNGGILFSMSGFTDNCIEEIRLKIASALIIPFGTIDIRNVMQDLAKMTDLLDDKIDQIMNHRLVLVDGEVK
jgi:hypothetical protein